MIKFTTKNEVDRIKTQNPTIIGRHVDSYTTDNARLNFKKQVKSLPTSDLTIRKSFRQRAFQTLTS